MKSTNPTLQTLFSAQQRKLLSLAAVAALGLAAQTFGQALLIDASTSGSAPSGVGDWTEAGVTETITSAAIGSVSNASSVSNISNLTGGVGPTNGQFSSPTYPGNDMLNSYIYKDGGSFNVTLGGFDDGTGTANTLTTNTDAYGTGFNGNSFTLQASTDYKLYLFGSGNADGQGTTFTFDGVSKDTRDDTAGSPADYGVTFTLTTPADLTDYELTFNVADIAGSSSSFYTWNGAALVQVPETSSFGLILGGFGLGLIGLRRRRQ